MTRGHSWKTLSQQWEQRTLLEHTVTTLRTESIVGTRWDNVILGHCCEQRIIKVPFLLSILWTLSIVSMFCNHNISRDQASLYWWIEVSLIDRTEQIRFT
jgi:hypothetical protein